MRHALEASYAKVNAAITAQVVIREMSDGKGRGSVLFNPPSANLTVSDKNDDYKKMIINYGGAAMGRSPVMPTWGGQLSTQEIDDVVKFLKTLLVVPPPQ